MCPDTRQHRGAHPADTRLFAAEQLPSLRTATAELSWLLTRGYAPKSALKTVGDRHKLTERQRLAVSRAACGDRQREGRAARRVPPGRAKGESLVIDGFNLIITTEAALGGGVLVRCRDDCVRDLSSVHGSYRSVRETVRAAAIIGEALAGLEPRAVRWLLDRPVSNSGRLAATLREMSDARGWPWAVEAVFNPDAEIAAATREVAVTSDSNILDRAARWLNLNEHLLPHYPEPPWLIDLNDAADTRP